MAFIGKGPSGRQVKKSMYKQWVAIASQTQFTFDRGIYDPNAIQVVVNDVLQEPNVDYTIAPNGGLFNVINFAVGLTAGAVVYAVDKDEGALRLNNSATAQTFSPAGSLSSVTVQAAIEELDTEKEPANANLVKKNVATLFTTQQTPSKATLAVSTTSSFTFDPVTNGQVQIVTLTNAITVTFAAPTNIVEGTGYKLLLKAGDTSVRNFIWNSAFKFPGASSQLATGTTNNGAYDVITFIGGPTNTLIFDGVGKDVR